MNLFKMWIEPTRFEDGVRIVFAKNAKEALNQIAEEESKDEYFRFMDEEWIREQDLPDELRSKIFESFSYEIDMTDETYKEIYKHTDLKEWHVKQLKTSYDDLEGLKLYKGYLIDGIEGPDDVHVIVVSNENEALDVLAKIMSKDVYYRQMVKERSINMSFDERFYVDEKGFVFEMVDDEVVPREDLIRKHGNIEKAITAIDKAYFENVNQFFAEKLEYEKIYLDYMKEKRDDLPDGIYYFCMRNDKDFERWHKVEEIEIPGSVRE